MLYEKEPELSSYIKKVHYVFLCTRNKHLQLELSVNLNSIEARILLAICRNLKQIDVAPWVYRLLAAQGIQCAPLRLDSPNVHRKEHFHAELNIEKVT